jgi:hypothetical protein
VKKKLETLRVEIKKKKDSKKTYESEMAKKEKKAQ